MEQTDNSIPSRLQKLLRVYQIEPVGYILVDRLRLPLPIISGLFIVLFFGIHFVLNGIAGIPRPPTFADALRPPGLYYPHLIGLTYDLLGYPLLLTLLIFIRHYIPTQLIQLEQAGFITERPRISRLAKSLFLLCANQRFQTVAIIMAATTVVTGFFVNVRVVPMSYGTYAVFLSMLGRYGILVAFIQFTYIFIILSNYTFDFRLHLNHPDQCSGLRPFGNMALPAYWYTFALAMMLAVGTFTSGTYFDLAIRNLTGSSFALLYLWVLFPIAVIAIFNQLLYKPHCALQRLQGQYLRHSSASWTRYHQQIASAISGAVESSESPLLSTIDFDLSDDLELLESWEKIDKYVADMHTWPIPKRTLRAIVISANPLIPVLLPVVADVIRRVLP